MPHTGRTAQGVAGQHVVHRQLIEGRHRHQKALSLNPEVKKHFTKEELSKVMDPANYLGIAPQMTDDVVAKARKLLG